MRQSPLRHPARLAGASLLRLQSDTRLAELAVAGHVAAFDAIVDRYRTPLLRYCAGIVGPSRAEDAVQQALINAHDALQRTDEVRHLRSWLYRIAHNAALNVLRTVRDDVSLDDELLPSGSGPAEAFETSERFRATVEALRELPERQRAALVLRELEGRSHEEIAEALGVTKGSARQHLMRARVAMRGAVTAITPYPIVVRLADALASPGGASWTDAAVGAGTGATLAKLTAGIAATGALVGGAAGTREVVRHHHGTPSASAETRGAAPVRAAAVRHAAAVVLPASAAPAPAVSAAPSSDDHHRATPRHRPASQHRHRHHGHAAPTVAPSPPTSPPVTSGTPGTGDDRSASPGRGPSGDDSAASRHGSQQQGSSDSGSSDGKGSSGRGSGDSGSGGSSGKGKNQGDDAPATVTVPTVTVPATTPTSGSGTSNSGSGDSGSGPSGSGTSGSDTGGTGSSGSGSSGSGSSGSSGPGSSGDDGTTTVADDD